MPDGCAFTSQSRKPKNTPEQGRDFEGGGGGGGGAQKHGSAGASVSPPPTTTTAAVSLSLYAAVPRV
jgi:hypothetical protein